MKPLVCSLEPVPDSDGLQTAPKVMSEDVTPFESPTENASKEGGASQSEDTSVNTKAIPCTEFIEQPEVPEETISYYDGYDYYEPPPMFDDYCDSFSNSELPLDSNREESGEERLDENGDKGATGESVQQNSLQSLQQTESLHGDLVQEKTVEKEVVQVESKLEEIIPGEAVQKEDSIAKVDMLETAQETPVQGESKLEETIPGEAAQKEENVVNEEMPCYYDDYDYYEPPPTFDDYFDSSSNSEVPLDSNREESGEERLDENGGKGAVGKYDQYDSLQSLQQTESLHGDLVQEKIVKEVVRGESKLEEVISGDAVQKEESIVKVEMLESAQETTVTEELFRKQVKVEPFHEEMLVEEPFLVETGMKDIIPKYTVKKEEKTARVKHLPAIIDQGTWIKEEIVQKETKIDSVEEEILVKKPVDIFGNPVEEVAFDDKDSESQTPKQSEENAVTGDVHPGKFSDEKLLEIWELAKKICEARCAYNQNVYRRLTPSMIRKQQQQRKRPAKSLVAQCRARPKAPDPTTNGGVCTIGKGYGWDDPPEWNWGQPLPEEICEVIQTKPPPNTPTICLDDDPICLSDEFSLASSSKWWNHSSDSPKFRGLKSLPGMIKSEDYGAITLDSDDELPDFSVELGLPKKIEPSPQKCYDVADSGSCTVIAVAPVNLAPTTRLGGKKRRLGSRNSAPGSSSERNVNPCEVVTLGSSSDSDVEVEEVPAPKKQAPEHEKPASKEDDSKKVDWSCPICLETKDKVSSVMTTICGHIFCGACLQSTLKLNKQCPTCRKKLTLRQIHNLYW